MLCEYHIFVVLVNNNSIYFCNFGYLTFFYKFRYLLFIDHVYFNCGSWV